MLRKIKPDACLNNALNFPDTFWNGTLLRFEFIAPLEIWRKYSWKDRTTNIDQCIGRKQIAFQVSTKNAPRNGEGEERVK